MARIAYTLPEMRRRGVLEHANHLLQTTPHHLRDDGLRLPRVSAVDRAVLPSLAEITAFEDGDRAADASYVVRTLAASVVETIASEIRSAELR